MKRVLTDILNWLNGVGSIILAYALLNPNAAAEFLNVLPKKLQTPTALMLPAAWFIIVQFAKARSIKKGAVNVAP
jgi:hypothetical protein